MANKNTMNYFFNNPTIAGTFATSSEYDALSRETRLTILTGIR